MNLLQTIGQYVRDGLTHAEMVVKLDVEHAIQVSEEWIAKIRGADGFAVVSGEPAQTDAEVAAEADKVLNDGAHAPVPDTPADETPADPAPADPTTPASE